MKYQLKTIDLDELKPLPENPRVHPESMLAKLERSIKEFGFTNPILALPDGTILAGHARLEVARKLGLKQVPVIFIDLPREKALAYCIADNKIALDSTWDYPKLKDLLVELDTGEFDIEITGFGLDEIEQLLTELPDAENEGVIETPEIEKRANPGDIWVLGDHKVACGDCTDVRLLDRLMQGAKVNTIVTSPPYAQQRKDDYGSIPADEYPEWFGGVARALWDVLDDAGSFFLNIKEHVEDGQRSLYVMKLVIAMVDQYGWRFVDELVWTKPGLPGGWPNRLRNDFEPVFWFAKGDGVDVVVREIEDQEGNEETNLVDEFGRVFHFSKQQKIRFFPKSVGKQADKVPIYTPQNKRKKEATGNITYEGPQGRGIARPGNVIRLQGNQEKWNHPAMYPVGLAEFLIKLTTVRGDLVMDPFLGSGSTLIAAEKTKRVCYGVELQPKYVDIVLARWEAQTGRKAVRLDGAMGEAAS